MNAALTMGGSFLTDGIGDLASKGMSSEIKVEPVKAVKLEEPVKNKL